MKTVAASVTIDALAAPIGYSSPAGRPCHELSNSDSYREIHQAGKRHVRVCETICGGETFMRSPFLPAVRPPLEISNCADWLLFTGCHIPEALEEADVTIAHAGSPDRDEAQMIAAIVAGDRELYHNLIEPYELSVYRMAMSFVKDEIEAEDVAQEAFLKAFRNLANFRGQSKFSTWLISITLNEARRRLRRQSTVRMESLDDSPEEGGKVSPELLRDWQEIPSEALERKEVRALLQRAIEELSPIYREVVVLRDIEELSVEETAGALAISISSVKVRLHRARIMLQKELAPKLKLAIPKKRRWLAWY